MAPEKLLLEIENLMERWLHGRENDNETLEKIREKLMNEGYLDFFKNK